jgi:hypothetical protein
MQKIPHRRDEPNHPNPARCKEFSRCGPGPDRGGSATQPAPRHELTAAPPGFGRRPGRSADCRTARSAGRIRPRTPPRSRAIWGLPALRAVRALTAAGQADYPSRTAIPPAPIWRRWQGEAVEALDQNEGILTWTNRFQLVYNALMARELTKAEAGFALLPVPEDESWIPARDKVRWMLERAAVVGGATALDRRDLRGWHFVLTGGLLTRLSGGASTPA